MAAAASAAPRRIPARELLAQDELAAVREPVEWKRHGPHRPCVGRHPRIDRARRGLSQSAHLRPRRHADRLAPARPRHPHARRRAPLPFPQRGAQHGAQPMAVRLSDFRRHDRLSPLSSRPPCPHAAGGRPRPRAVGAVPDHQGELSPQVLARPHRADRLPAEEGAAPQRARATRHGRLRGACAISGEKLGPQIGRQRRAAGRARAGRRLVGLSARCGWSRC